MHQHLLGLFVFLGLLAGSTVFADDTVTPPALTYPVMASPVALAEGSDYFRLQKKIYRWNDQSKFVFVHITMADYLPDWRPENVPLVKNALSAWQRAMDNRLIFMFVSEPAGADVVVNWWDQARGNVEHGACGLNQTWTWGKYISQNDIYISLHQDDGTPWPPEQLYTTALHEAGHMIGIKVHSDHPLDVMAPTSLAKQLTARDIATVKQIYLQKPHYTNPVGYRLSNFEAFKKTQKGKGLRIPIPIPIPF